MMQVCIRLNQVSVYVPGREAPVLAGLDMDIAEGEWLAVVGPNGCGKSVLARLLAGLDGRYDGEIGRSASGASVGLVMQNPEAQLVGETVWEDMVFGLECRGMNAKDIQVRALEALERAGLGGCLHMPINHLSGGQKQLLALAGVLAAGPAVLVTDEATSMLDPASREQFNNTLRELHRSGMTVIMITQLLEETSSAERILALSGGGMAYWGGVREFYYDPAGGRSPCEHAGLLPPYTVRVVQELEARGLQVPGRPLIPEELERAVREA